MRVASPLGGMPVPYGSRIRGDSMDWEKIHRKTLRLESWDYSQAGWYYITICTANRVPCLGNVVDEQVLLTPLGQRAEEQWLMLPTFLPYVELDYHVIMPDHMHGILAITESGRSTLGNIVNLYKGSVTKWAKQNGHGDFRWQRSFFDHVVRNDKSLAAIREYITTNALRLTLEKSYPDNF